MFHSLFITTESGVCIFEQHFTKSKIDSQLITGFINALGAFATEALGSGMQSLKLQTGEQLFIYPLQDPPIIGIVIVDPRDNSKLIRKFLLQILTEFSAIFQRDLETKHSSDITKFQEFRYAVDLILEGKVSSRTNFKMFLGVLVGLILMGIMVLAFVPAIIQIDKLDLSTFGLQDIIFSDANLTPAELQSLQRVTLTVIGALMLFNCIIFLLPTLLSAYIAGSKKRGIWTALLLSASIGLLLLIGSIFTYQLFQINAIFWYIAFSPLLISLSLLCGFYGGRLKEQRKLYPLKEPENIFADL